MRVPMPLSPTLPVKTKKAEPLGPARSIKDSLLLYSLSSASTAFAFRILLQGRNTLLAVF